MRILITGGLGFVGGRLAAHLADAGHQIVLGSRKAINPSAWLPQAEVLQIEWDNCHALELSCNGVDIVIHAAGMNAQDCATDPVAALAFNGLATARLVSAAIRSGVKKFIYLSTAHVYASPLKGNITEATCPRNLHPYATSHLAGEQAILSASQLGQIKGIVLRLSNAFGVPMHKDVNCWMLLVNDLCRQAVTTRNLVLHSNGLQNRDFVAIDKVCCLVECLLAEAGTGMVPPIFNIGSGKSQSVLEMAQMVQIRCKHVLGYEPKLRRSIESSGAVLQPLDYIGGAINKVGLQLLTNPTNEIDNLLRFCCSQFGQLS